MTPETPTGQWLIDTDPTTFKGEKGKARLEEAVRDIEREATTSTPGTPVSEKVSTAIGLVLWFPLWLIGLVVEFLAGASQRAFNIYWPGDDDDG